jgi:IclR family transcriptional regulator, KDG regulon repressor
LRMDRAIGRRVPAYCTALGKILLAGLNKDQLNQYIKEVSLAKNTKNTITSKRNLRDHLAEARKQGYAIDDEELDYGIRCIAAPIKNHSRDTIASISIAGPSTRMTLEKIGNMKKPIMETVLKISKQLGFK